MAIDDKQLIKVRILARVSTKDQTSTSAQIEAIKKHLAKFPERAIDKIIVEKRTGADKKGIYNPLDYMKQRPQFYNECYLPATRKEYDELWVWKWDRFARSDLPLIRMFEDVGIKLHSLMESDNPDVRDIQGTVSRIEIRKIKERVELKHQELLEKKKVLNRPPLGYKFNKGKFIVDEENKEAVKKMFELTLQEFKPKQICTQIKIVRTRKKHKKIVNLPIATYLRCLRNKTYEGIYKFRGEEKKGDYPTPYKDLFLKVKGRLENANKP